MSKSAKKLGNSPNIETSHAFAARVLAEMRKAGAPASPKNFNIWHTHLSGEKPDLSKDLEKVLSNDATFSAHLEDEIFERHFTNTRLNDAALELSAKVEGEVVSVVEALQDQEKNTSAYGDALAGASGQLSGAQDTSAIRMLVSNLIAATKTMESHSRNLEGKLSVSTKEISRLRANLESMRREAMTDALTGVANRKAFDMALRSHLEASRESGKPVSLMMGDIDHFKSFNDNFGHQTGDQVLKLVAGVMSAIVKGRDLVARYGGEEFAIILPETKLEHAKKLAETIRTTVEGKRLRKKSTNEDLGTVTLSLGIAENRENESAYELVERADDHLYQAKRGGRNQVCDGGPVAVSTRKPDVA